MPLNQSGKNPDFEKKWPKNNPEKPRYRKKTQKKPRPKMWKKGPNLGKNAEKCRKRSKKVDIFLKKHKNGAKKGNFLFKTNSRPGGGEVAAENFNHNRPRAQLATSRA